MGPPVGPVRLRSSARYVPCPYQPWVKTVTDVVFAPVLNVVDSCCHEGAEAAQVLALTPVPVAPR